MLLAVYKVKFKTEKQITDEEGERLARQIEELMENFENRANLAIAGYCPKGVTVEIES